MAGLLDKHISNISTDSKIYPYRIVYLFYDNLCIYPAERIDLLEIEPKINPSNFLSYFEQNSTS